MEDGDIQIINKFVAHYNEQTKEVEQLKKKINELERIVDHLRDIKATLGWTAHHLEMYIKEKGLFMDLAEWDYNQYQKAKDNNDIAFLEKYQKAQNLTWY